MNSGSGNHTESTMTASFAESSVDETRGPVDRHKIKKLFFKRRGNVSSGDGDISAVENEGDLTPGSLEVWLDLPDEIKYDPSLAPFKHRYEQEHGRLEAPAVSPEGDKTIFGRSPTLNPNEPLANTAEQPNKTGTDRFLEPTLSEEAKEPKSKKRKRFERWGRVLKLAGLTAAWLLLTTALLLNQEKNDVVLHTAVTNPTYKVYQLDAGSGGVKLLLTLTGPFLPEDGRNRTSDSGSLHVWLHRQQANSTDRRDYEQNSSIWSLDLMPNDALDFSPSETRTKIINLPEHSILRSSASAQIRSIENVSDFDIALDAGADSNDNAPANESGNYGFNSKGRSNEDTDALNEESPLVSLRMHTTSESTVPLTLTYQLHPLDPEDGIIYAAILLCFLYVLIIFEIVNRTLAALLSSSLGVAVLALGGARPTLPELVSWLDVETLLLLFSMMLLVAILAETGLFDYLAVLAFELTGGKTWPLINCLCFFTALFSTFLDNVTTVLLMTPVTIRLCEVMQLNPVPVLMSMVIFSNVGGAATPVGDPPNVIIASHPAVVREGINFTTFTLHMTVGILLVCVQTYFQLRYMYRDMNKLRHSVPQDLQELRQEMAVWRRAAASLSSYSRDEDLVRKALEKKVAKLSVAIARREAGGGASSTDPVYCATLAHMKQKYKIRDKVLLIKAALCVTFVVMVFFLHAFPVLQRLSLGWTALLGALLLLLLAEREDLEPVLARVEWSTLLFFAALFVLMEALSKLGLIAWIGGMTQSIILNVNEESRLAVALMLVLWVSGLASAFVDNIPLTTMMIRVVTAMAEPGGLALPLSPLIWALSFGACLGGNGTLIGASANVVCAGVAEQHGYRFTFLQFLLVGFPVMVGNLIVTSAYLLIAHCLFTWH